MISFTGGTVTARAIIQASAPHYKKLSLELGGKNPGIVFDDADMSKCVAGIVRSSFTNQGEICLCTSRIYVQESIFETFLQRLVEETRKTITIGNPSHPGTTMGPLVSREHYNKVISYVGFAKEDGARILCGETVDPAIRDSLPAELQDGYFMRPTIVANLPESSRCIQEEIFGPVIVVNSFKDEADVIERSNGVKYGLAASIWTENVGRMHRVAHAIDAGTVWGNCWMVRDLNMPFGGMKQSGIGREGGQDSIEFFTEAKTICVKM
ncbi:aldehyde dehydrogenase family 8 member A1 [Capsaspora owczarzaki ATCC 30864]|uniref:Aldehyde dehydrogenase family 8 member A1 n=2 Tax=Capsaspora owczarzaki (strain ATCC 30864) TaxID=595528 RepID=A0A0D2UM52_CAPO3|nr:aldehyde dehydrogenase family 8 member A1 [Capsaspora owczarzaki ATCC 30864]